MLRLAAVPSLRYEVLFWGDVLSAGSCWHSGQVVPWRRRGTGRGTKGVCRGGVLRRAALSARSDSLLEGLLLSACTQQLQPIPSYAVLDPNDPRGWARAYPRGSFSPAAPSRKPKKRA